MSQGARCAASFRDPSGFIFGRAGTLYRQVNLAYRDHFDRLVESGLYRELTDAGLLIPHDEVDEQPWQPALAYRVLRPEPVEFISYPYEWCFSQLKDAALLTLEIQRRALAAGMALKDASAYNVQFQRGRPILIDTLSFEAYHEGRPWVAYRQFCQHFLAPLALMSRLDVRLGQLLRTYIDGVPLDLAGRLLPWRSFLRPGLLLHLRLHARAQDRCADDASIPASRTFSRRSMLGLIDHLRSTIGRLAWSPAGTAWAEYTADNTYTPAARERKSQLVAEFLEQCAPRSVWDLGANVGEYSRVAAGKGFPTVAFDFDPACVERNYLEVVRHGERNLLPLFTDLTNPSPSLGWAGQERLSLLERGPAGAVLALALVHHLAIANNVPLRDVAEFLHRAGHWLVIEFVPKEDVQVARLLRSREDIFDAYDKDGFEAAFETCFTIVRCEPIPNSERILYLMKRREPG
jgi:hypothetical protein